MPDLGRVPRVRCAPCGYIVYNSSRPTFIHPYTEKGGQERVGIGERRHIHVRAQTNFVEIFDPTAGGYILDALIILYISSPRCSSKPTAVQSAPHSYTLKNSSRPTLPARGLRARDMSADVCMRERRSKEDRPQYHARYSHAYA